MKYCQNCGASAPDEAKFCPDCGQPFPSSDAPVTTRTITGKKTEPFAIGAFVLSLLSVVTYANVVVVALATFALGSGLYSLVELHLHHDRKGKGFAIAAIVIALVMLVLAILSTVRGETIASVLAALASAE